MKKLCKELCTRAARSVSDELGIKHTSALAIIARAAGYSDYSDALRADFGLKSTEHFRNNMRASGLSWRLVFSICPATYDDNYRIPIDEDFKTAEWSRPEASSGDILRFYYKFYGDISDYKTWDLDYEEYLIVKKVRAQTCMECLADGPGNSWVQAMLYRPESQKYSFIRRSAYAQSDVWDDVDDAGEEDLFFIRQTMRDAWFLPRATSQKVH